MTFDMRGNLYQPLGLDLPERPQRRSIRKARFVGVLFAVAIIAGSIYTAIPGQPHRLSTDFFSRADSSTPDKMADAPPVTIVSPSEPVARSPMPTIISGPDSLDPSDTAGGVGFRIEDPASQRQSPAVAHLPDPDLVQESPYGPLPVRSADGRRPFDVYAGAPADRPGTRIAIVLGGLGISQTGTYEALKALPAGVTLGFAPQGNSLDRWMQEARRAGHELLLQVPLEPVGYPQIDPGANTVTDDDAIAGRFDKLYASLGRITNYVGIMNYMGGRFTGDQAAMSQLLTELGRRGLMFFDDGTSSRSVSADTARSTHVPSGTADLALDRSQSPADIRRQLDTLEQIARSEGRAIGVASAFDSSIATISEWARDAEARGIQIVPLSALASDPESR